MEFAERKLMETLFPMNKKPLPSIAHARKADPSTSHEAAAKVYLSEPMRNILLLLHTHQCPFTDEMIYKHVINPKNQTPQSYRQARLNLVRAGYVRKYDENGKTRRGNRACRWILN